MSTVPLAKRLRRALRYYVLRVLGACIALLPVRAAGALGGLGGGLYGRLARGERRKALESLAIAFPERTDAERAQLADACFRHLGKAGCELMCHRQLDARIETWVAWDEAERQALKAAAEGGRGVILVTAHLGSWEMLARRIGLTCHPMSAVAREAPDPRTTRWIEEVRARAGCTTLWRGREGSARALLGTLRKGGILTLLIDQDTKVQSLFVPFFGRLAATPRAAADLALRTGAVVMTGFCCWEPPGRYRLVVREQPVHRGGDDEADALALTAALSRAIEEAIRLAPAQWVWMHRRWKTQP